MSGSRLIYEEGLMIAIVLSGLFMNLAMTSYSTGLTVLSSGKIGLDWLHTEGRYIVNGEGSIVTLRGANFMGYEFGAWASHTEEDYARMASWGFNVVRLPIAWHYIEPEPGIYNMSYLEEHVDRDIRWAEKYRMYVILDMHQWYWSSHFTFFSQGSESGNGVPSWLVSAYPDTKDGQAQAITDFWLGKGPNGTEATQVNPSMERRLITVWERVVQRYANEATIAAFDILNEPPLGKLSGEEHAEYLYRFYEALLNETRRTDNKHMIMYENTATCTCERARCLDYPNVIFSFHFYRLREHYDCNITELEGLFNSCFDYVTNWKMPIFVGEFNTQADYPNATQWIRDILSILDKHDLGWTWWTYYRTDYYTAALCYQSGAERYELTESLKTSQ